MSKVYGFDEAGFRRVQEATRRTLGGPRVGSQRRRQVPVLSGGTGSGGSSGGESDCACGGCLSAGAIDACGAIGEAPTEFVLATSQVFPDVSDAVDIFGSEIVLTHDSSCTWLSDTFENVDLGDGEHDYVFKLVFSGTDPGEVELTLEDET